MIVQERLEAEDRALLCRLAVGTIQRIKVEDGHWLWMGNWSSGGRVPVISGNSVRVSIYCQLVDQVAGTEMVVRTCDEEACIHPHHMTVQPKGRRGFRGKS